ncbi:DUF2306 domain-containing protein [Nocardiopsis sp. NRRL B-16309]|uniref:DUF2306 domain-containing protein n=1 Tax=Nocardiopsis sp. NRRL B-16309 TaxID=1519494 RepID=UPI0006B04059|nr:DUF2306 domain-containing protein [Nocardiopsis sp. NRRL B-16309]KOX12612.1 hypothetical protein ADL05_20615 [Nocardiopsis sp. NRRL B-16309]
MDAPSTTTSSSRPRPRPRSRRPRVGLVVLTALCVLTALFAVSSYVGLDPGDSQVGLREDVAFHYPLLIVHIVTSTLALLALPLQFWPALRRSGAHRVIGRAALFAGVLPGAVSGLGVAVLGTSGLVAQAGFALLSVLWFTFAAAGYRAVRQGRHADHREWMVRVFALTLAGVTLRVLIPLLTLLLLPLLEPVYGGDEDLYFLEIYQAITWLCWVPNLIAAEWYLRRRGR